MNTKELWLVSRGGNSKIAADSLQRLKPLFIEGLAARLEAAPFQSCPFKAVLEAILSKLSSKPRPFNAALYFALAAFGDAPLVSISSSASAVAL